MIRALTLMFFVYAALVIGALADCLGGEELPRRLPRALWALIIVLVPFAGAILWFTSGRARPLFAGTGAGAAGRGPGGGTASGDAERTDREPGAGGPGLHRYRGGRPEPKRDLAPDDDPEFLRELDRKLKGEDGTA